MGFYIEITAWLLAVSILIGGSYFPANPANKIEKSVEDLVHYTLSQIFTAEVEKEAQAAFQQLGQFAEDEAKMLVPSELFIRRDSMHRVEFEIPLKRLQPQTLQFHLTEKTITVRAQDFQNRELEHSLDLPTGVRVRDARVNQSIDRLVISIPR